MLEVLTMASVGTSLVAGLAALPRGNMIAAGTSATACHPEPH